MCARIIASLKEWTEACITNRTSPHISDSIRERELYQELAIALDDILPDED
jgi:hypothetical protein